MILSYHLVINFFLLHYSFLWVLFEGGCTQFLREVIDRITAVVCVCDQCWYAISYFLILLYLKEKKDLLVLSAVLFLVVPFSDNGAAKAGKFTCQVGDFSALQLILTLKVMAYTWSTSLLTFYLQNLFSFFSLKNIRSSDYLPNELTGKLYHYYGFHSIQTD